MNESMKIGLKPGSQNTCMAWRDDERKIQFKPTKTCVWYPKSILQKRIYSEPVVGEEATLHADADYPLNLGLVEKETGFQQIKDILKKLNIPQCSDMVIASPAMEINKGKMLLSKAVDEISNPNRMWMLSEALCSAVYVLDDPNKIKEGTYIVANLGSSTLEFGCFHEAETVHLSAHSETSGDNVDKKIMTRIQNTIGDAMITQKEARDQKEKSSLTTPKQFIVRGQNRDGIVETEVCDEIIEPLRDYANSASEIIKKELKIIHPEIRKAALENPLIVSGGMSNIEGLPELIIEKLNEKMNWKFDLLYSEKHNSHIAPAIGALLLAEAIANEE